MSQTAAQEPTADQPTAVEAVAKSSPAKRSTPARPATASRPSATKSSVGLAPPVLTPAPPDEQTDRFFEEQRILLLEERATYVEQAEILKAEAEALAQDMEPGDVQFDDESGEGGTTNVDRERDLALSAQARAAVDEIDYAMSKLITRTYGICERCGTPIPKARLKALPQARLCIDCKSGGLSRR